MLVYAGEALSRYGFGDDHPFGSDRYHAFWRAFSDSPLMGNVEIHSPVSGTPEDLLLFHNREYIDKVKQLSDIGSGMLDPDTPVFPGIFEAGLVVIGTVLDAVENIILGNARKAFVPIAGLHHARRGTSAGFCVFNDCGIAIEALRRRHGIRRIAYVDIDAHHGDGVYYGFEDDPKLIFADIHEDGRYLYPGTGDVTETGRPPAEGTKLNVPLPPGASDTLFAKVWPTLESFVREGEPEFILFQCGADSLQGDPLTHMALSSRSHALAARRLAGLADELCQGRMLALGGGGYNLENISAAWLAVIQAMNRKAP